MIPPVMDRALTLAGIFGARDPAQARAELEQALALDGLVQTAHHGALVVGWVGEAGPGEIVVDGVIDVEPSTWDQRGLGHARGDFLVVSAQHAFVARDQLGARPGYWMRDGDRVLFAGHVRQLLALAQEAPRHDPVSLAAWVAPGALDVDRTLYAGVHRLPGGWLLDLARAEACPYWRPEYRTPRRTSREDAARRASDALTEAVRRRCTGPDTAVMLSGGVDSSSIAAVARHRVAEPLRPLRAYSAAFPDHPATDEGERIRLVAGALGLDLHVLEVRGGSVLQGARDYIGRWSLPPVSPNAFFWPDLLRRAAADGTRVILDGEGGDEVFAAPLHLLGDLVARGRLVAAWRLLGRAPSNYPSGLSPRSKRHVARTLALPSARTRRTAGAPRWWTAQAAAVLHGAAPAQGQDHIARRAAGAGLLARHPIQDLDLIETLLAIPPRHHFDRRSRPLLREAVAGLVPDAVRLRRDKSPFDSVFHAALDGPDREGIAALLEHPHPALAATTDVPAVRRMQAADPPASALARAHRGLVIWRVATADQWLKSVYAPNLSMY